MALAIFLGFKIFSFFYSSQNMSGVQRRRGEIIDTLPENAQKVNRIGNTDLESDYWLDLDTEKIYKKTPSKKYRSLVLQTSRSSYPHYFFMEKDTKRKLTLCVLHLDRLNYLGPKNEVGTRELTLLLKNPDTQDSISTVLED
jgi:hypothetical protein